MKKLVFLAVLCCVIISCKKDSDSKHNLSLQEYNVKLKANTDDLGASHNNGISYSINSNPLAIEFLFPNKNTPENSSSPVPNVTPQDVRNIILSTYDFVGSVYGSDSRGITLEVIPIIVNVVNAPNTMIVNAKMDSIENILIQNNLLTAREALMLQEIQDIFTVGYQLNMTSNQAGPYFTNKLNALKTKYANIVWNVNEGEAFLGMLSIAESSNEYWHSNPTSPSISASKTTNYQTNSLNLRKKMNTVTVPAVDPDEPEGSLVHVDAAAYAIAWGWAVYDDWSKGNLNESGQSRRITKGLQAAITASAMRRVIQKWGSYATVDLFIDSSTGNPGGPSVPTGPTIEVPGIGLSFFNYGENIDRIEALIYGNEITFNTQIFLKNGSYYSDSNFTCLLPNGFYTRDNFTVYQIQDGRAVNERIVSCSNCAYATLGPQQNPFTGCGLSAGPVPTPAPNL